MFGKLFSKKREDKPETSSADPLQLALAALFVEAARADEQFDDDERALISKALQDRFAISEADATSLCREAETAQENATDIQRFTRIAKEMPHDEKLSFIETLWEIVLSDGLRDPFEDTLIRRVCGLIYVDDRASGEARGRAEARLAKG
jgi:uncharacterized tellurite resistance protein B-like protein